MAQEPMRIGFKRGGRVHGPGTGTSDSIPARLSHGEYVLPADTVRAVGVNALDALRNLTHKPAGNGGGFGMGFADGGLVDPLQRQPAQAAAPAAASPSVAPVAPTQPSGWQAQNDLRNAQVSASSIVKDQNQQAAARQVQAMTAPSLAISPTPNPAQAGIPTTPAIGAAAPKIGQSALAGTPSTSLSAPSSGAISRLGNSFSNVSSANTGPEYQGLKMDANDPGNQRALGSIPTFERKFADGGFVSPAEEARRAAAQVSHDNQLQSAQALQARASMPKISQPGTEASRAAEYLSALDQENAMRPSWFQQDTPTSGAKLAVAQKQSSDALQKIYQPSAPATQGSPATTTAPAGQAPAPISAGRSSASFAATDPRRVDLGPSSAPGVLGQVARSGDSYSGTNVAGDIAVNGKPAGGTVTMLGGNPGDLTSAERMAMDQRAHDINLQSIGLRQQLADAQAGYTPGVNIVGSDRSYGNMRERTPEQAARDAAVSASSITANAGLSARQMRQFAGQDRRNAIEQQQVDATLRGQDMTQSLGLLNAGQRSENERRAADIERAKLGILGRRTDAEVVGMGADARVKGVQANAAEQLAGLRQRYMAATKPEEQAAIAKQIDVLSGREKQSLRDNFMDLGGGQEWNAAAGAMQNVPKRLIDLRTMQEVAPAQAKQPQRPVGTVSDVGGKKAVWNGSQWVPQ